MHGESEGPCRAQVTKELKGRDQAKVDSALLAYKHAVEQQWISRAAWMVYGVGISLNEFDGLVKTATRTTRTDCDGTSRRWRKQAAENMWFWPLDGSEMALAREGDGDLHGCNLFEHAWANLWDVDSGGTNNSGRHPQLADDLSYITLQELKRRHRTPLADEYLTAKIILYTTVGTIALHSMYVRI
tara:strand:+ start:25 stop:582 length:558 start_codon:yes stop_codon:yes gene_type:complete|mmetsp:Transcript_40575/g.97234  ORF Transcript_40575/g.97234 Transcript_40575/m.97234 type:complete len:186 (+) Transcript_40575:339-896(+)